MNTIVVLAVTAVALTLLFLPKVRHSTLWRATVTPLASIIGSGFLVIGPLLTHQFGNYAVIAMLAIIVTGYAIGSAVRYNISNIEPLLNGAATGAPELISSSPKPHKITSQFIRFEGIAGLLLAFAYVVSVSFYLQLLGAFLLRGVGIQDVLSPQVIACIFLIAFGLAGYRGDLTVLENLEEYAVSIKLAVIAGMLFGLFIYNLSIIFGHQATNFSQQVVIESDNIRALLGMLIVVQGFETSRYLGSEYSAKVRCNSMRRAQLLSGFIYIAFIALITPLAGLQSDISETAIIDLGGEVSWALPALLITAALMSQFSAAVADTIGGGGLMSEVSGKRFSSRKGYLYLTSIALVVTLLTDIYAVVSLASRAFALYYFLQCIEAALAARQHQVYLRSTCYSALALLMLLVVIFGIPIE